jgi:tetratricopeptide (TPR) repeat protein
MVSEAAPEKLQASIAAPITQPTNKEKADAAPADKSTKDNLEGANKATNAIGMVWQGKFKELLAQAKEQFDRQDYIQAESTFQEALKISPDDYFALSNIGVVQFQLGKMSEAEESLKKAADKSKDSSFALTTLGIVHYRQQRYDDAERVLRKSISVNDQDFTAHNYLGIVLAASGKGKAGESEIMRAIEINPQYADAHFNLAVIYATGKPPAKMMAKQHYKKALELGSPPDPSLEHLLQ